MTDRNLLALYHERMAQMEATNRYGRYTLRDLREQEPAKRAEVDRASEAFRAADAAIVEELIARGKPAELKGMTLHLTRDRESFVALQPGTMLALGFTKSACERAGIRSLITVQP